jgi:putative MATE family efflux protein
MIDTVMVGRLGESEIAAVGIANQYFFFFSLIVMSIYSGCGIFMSQFWGKRDIQNIKRVLGIGLLSGIIVSAIFMAVALIIPGEIIALFNPDPHVVDLGGRYLRIVCLGYIFTAVTLSYSFGLRSMGKTVLPMIVSAIALLCNTFFNYMFIFGNFGAPVMGVEGAALATVIARIVESIGVIGLVYVKKEAVATSFKDMAGVSVDFVVKIYKTTVPVILNEACWGLGFMVYSAAYGRISTQAVASVQICSTITNLFMVVVFGMANSSSIMVGNRIGAGEEEVGRDYARRFSLLGVFAGIVLGSLLSLTAPFMVGFFNVSSAVLHDSIMILYIISGVMIFRVFNIMMIVGVFRGGGDAKYAFIAEAFTMWFIGVPLAFIGAIYLKLPVYYVYAMLTAEEIVKAALCLIRLKSGKWIRNVTHSMA